MIINYNVSGSDRKQLVAAIAEHTGEKAKYLGAPGFAYQIGGFTVSVDGKVTFTLKLGGTYDRGTVTLLEGKPTFVVSGT